MASVFADTNTTFPRSHSSSNLPDLTSDDFKPIQAAIKSDELPRSASYTCLPVVESASYTVNNDSSHGSPQKPLSMVSEKDENVHNTKENVKPKSPAPQEERPRIGRTKSLVSRPKSWLQRAVKGYPERKSLAEQRPPVPPLPTARPIPDMSKNVSESFATFARKTWISASRSPSPNNRVKKKGSEDSTIDEDESTAPSSITSSSPKTSLPESLSSGGTAPDVAASSPAKASTWKIPALQRKKSRRLSVIPSVLGHKSENISDISLPGSVSEKESTARTSVEVPRLSKTFTKEKLASFGIDSARKKDELWSSFRSLDLDYQKFHSKSNALRTNVVRSTLIPFLRNYAQHPSNKSLRPEDLDKRVAILNKWWLGLLEMLDGPNNQFISGVDRPIVLEAITGIMTRPEWRLAPSIFAPIAEKASFFSQPRPRSSGSMSSGTSQFLAESVYHNVRNIFVQNLLSQMSMAVDKMALRTAPASLVTFCGKAAAYAFFFCPGVAEILVRVWGLPPETIRRVVDGFGLDPRRRGSDGADEITVSFPPNLHSLSWKSSKALVAQLRSQLNLPPAVSKIPWYGHWGGRWCGRDSDLFFVFCKYYHILLEEFLPPGTPLLEKARAPGFVLVHAQILVVLDASIHRQAANDAAAAALALSMDDAITGVDATAAPLPLPPSSNVTRLMPENRLIMLLRDFISERSAEFGAARHTFAEAFGTTMRACASKTSQFDQNACFLLCDFMEEALTIYLRFQNGLETHLEYIDWSFWFDVCRKMLGSQNTMTEIRLFSFIFGAWNMITADEKRKESLCFAWLLAEDTFRKYFLHWCPMIRAYYMRLLCWRLCRFDDEPSALDTKIYGAVFDGLRVAWSNYLYQKHEAEKDRKLLPSILPCNPAPGRRLLIIRNDNQIPTANLFLGFDGIVQAFQANQSTAYKRHSSLAGLVRSDSTDFNVPAEPSNKKRWSILGKIMPFNSPDVPGHGPHSPLSQKPISPLDKVRQDTASARTRPPLKPHHKSSSSDDSTPPSPTHRAFSFKFSLEWTPPPHQPHLHIHQQPQNLNTENNRPQKGANNNKNHNNHNKEPPTLQLTRTRLAPPRLPAPTHAFLVGTVPGTATEVLPKRSGGGETKYAGRALAEWTLVVKECNNFVERRRHEGVPGLKSMEVPTLGVEGFRKWT